MVRSLGADHVVDYTRENFTWSDQRHDLIVDMVGNRGLLEARRVLKPERIFVIVGGLALRLRLECARGRVFFFEGCARTA